MPHWNSRWFMMTSPLDEGFIVTTSTNLMVSIRVVVFRCAHLIADWVLFTHFFIRRMKAGNRHRDYTYLLAKHTLRRSGACGEDTSPC